MNKRDWPVYGILRFIYLAVACLLAKVLDLITYLVLKVVMQFAEVSYFAMAIASVVTVSLGLLAILGVLCYREGHRNAAFDPLGASVTAVGAALVHFVLGLLPRFSPVLWGPVRHLSGLVWQGSYYNSLQVTQAIPFGYLAVTGAVIMLVYAGVMILAEYWGCRNRLRSRRELTGSNEAAI